MAERPEEWWVDESAGPVVRPFAVARGRTRHASADFDLLAEVVSAGRGGARTPEDERILELCGAPLSVAELASDLALPLGVVRVLLGDLLDRGLILVRRAPEAPRSAGTFSRM
ncbi:DUF742 domain-containing protein [Actinomadura yumaensis]|uniref:DUF742 domain-containing protein n=1 Tax=Actinomadura yumaensis TaxID=111807 RepID=UPI003607846B